MQTAMTRRVFRLREGLDGMADIAAAHDISGLGRCSLVTAIGILSAMGHQCCPVPTAILPAQTGFGQYESPDLTAYLSKSLDIWKALSFRPDFVYTGFLGSGEQAEILADWLESRPDTPVVVDPVMGDGGQLYPCYPMEHIDKMRKLAAQAWLLTPNLTELCLLAGTPYKEGMTEKEIAVIALSLPGERLRWVAVTGIPDGDQIGNLLLDREDQSWTLYPTRDTGIHYSGTGDVFASVLCGAVASGLPVGKAVSLAARFLERTIRSAEPGQDPRYGVPYEKHLGELVSSLQID